MSSPTMRKPATSRVADVVTLLAVLAVIGLPAWLLFVWWTSLAASVGELMPPAVQP